MIITTSMVVLCSCTLGGFSTIIHYIGMRSSMGILEHLESHAIKDIFYDGAGPFCPWMSNPGFDFFVIEKHQPCILSTTRKSRWKT